MALKLFLTLLSLGLFFSGVDLYAQTCTDLFKLQTKLSLSKKKTSWVDLEPQAIKTRSLDDIDKLRLSSYNVENLNESARRVQKNRTVVVSTVGESKSVEYKLNKRERRQPKVRNSKVKNVGKVIRDRVAADIYALQELADGSHLLEGFVKRYLGDAFESRLSAGNDKKMSLGMLVKKDLPLNLEFRSHKNRSWSDPAAMGAESKVFNRDAQVTIYRLNGFMTPILVTINIHSKSKAYREGDPDSQALRTAQHKAVVRVYNNLKTEFGEDLPVIIMGDTNTNVETSLSLELIKKEGFIDVLEMLEIPKPQRLTHAYYPKKGKAKFQQLDALFVSPSLQPHIIDAGVYQYEDSRGKKIAFSPSRELAARSQAPSDHRPIWLYLDFQSLISKVIDQ